MALICHLLSRTRCGKLGIYFCGLIPTTALAKEFHFSSLPSHGYLQNTALLPDRGYSFSQNHQFLQQEITAFDEVFDAEPSWLKGSLTPFRVHAEPQEIVPYLSDRLATSSPPLRQIFSTDQHPLISEDQFLTDRLAYYAAKHQAPLELVLHNSFNEDLLDSSASELFFESSHWYELDQLKLSEHFLEQLDHSGNISPLIAHHGRYGFQGELGEMSSESMQSRRLIPGRRVSLVGGSTDMQRYSVTNPFNSDVARSLTAYPDHQVPRVGIKYEFLPEQISGFYLFDQHMLQGGPDGIAEEFFLLSPFGGDNHRAGVQANLMDGRWMFQASSFYSETDTSSMFAPSPYFDWSRGIEVSVHAKVTNNWKTTLRFTEVESRISSPQGSADWAPPHRSSTAYSTLWNRYNLVSNEKETLSIGLGTRLSSSYRRSYANSLLLPGYSRWDLGLFYQRESLEFRFYVKGILDRDYYNSFNYLMNSPDSPLSIDAQLHFRY